MVVLILVSLACSLPVIIDKATPTPPLPTELSTIPTQTAVPLPPAFAESNPPPGSILPLSGTITLYFNQPMDRGSVESAISGEPTLSGRFEWMHDSAISFTPDASFLPDTKVTINIGDSAQSQQGLSLLEPVNLVYSTPGYLRLSQRLPAPGSSDVDAGSFVMAAFNYPVVALGADPVDKPQPFSIDPPIQGYGGWVNTSTYIFYPQPALAGGESYSVTLNPNLEGTDGNPLLDAESWTFTTAPPALLSIEPQDRDEGVPLDAAVNLTFNQAMDPASVVSHLSLSGTTGERIPGQTKWDESFTTLTFTATELLRRDEPYTVQLNAEAESAGGTPLGRDTRITWRTLPDLAVAGSQPVQDGMMNVYSSAVFDLTSILPQEGIEEFLSIQPQVSGLRAIVPEGEKQLHIFADFKPETQYTLTLSAELSDLWGSSLKEPYALEFRTVPLEPNLILNSFNNVVFLMPDDKSIPAQATNLSSIDLSLGNVPLQDFIAMLSPTGYDFYRTYIPVETSFWRHTFDIPSNHSQPIDIPLTPNDNALEPGIYMLNIQTPLPGMGLPPLLIVSEYHTTLKLSSSDVLVWVVDLLENTPGESLPVTIYDESGALLATGTTDSEGVFTSSIPTPEEPYLITYAVVGNPGDEHFSMAVSGWDQGITPNSFNLLASYAPIELKSYIYTDRPIYRPGQTVYFRGVVRDVREGEYNLPDISSYPVTIFDAVGKELASFELPLSGFGTIRGHYTLLPDAQPGYYRLGEDRDAIWFQVAEYRKPEINLQVSFSENEIQAGQSLSAGLEARYFFDAPAGGVPLHWAVYAAPSDFYMPGYQVGTSETPWLENPQLGLGLNLLGDLIQEGEGETGPDGGFSLDFQTQVSSQRLKYTLEVTLKEESGFPVSARASALANPADFFIGIRPTSWGVQAGQPLNFEVMLVDWTGSPAGEHDLRARLQKVTWVREDPGPGERDGYPTYMPEFTLIESKPISSGADGSAPLSFVPPEPGSYQVDISGEGALTQIIVWVGGPGQVEWPNLPNQKIHLTADQRTYLPGETAQVFIPNPFQQDTIALMTIERGTIMRYEPLALEPGGASISLQISEEHVPNIYVSVTLISYTPEGKPDFRQGYVQLLVEPVEQVLDVEFTSQTVTSAPGEPVSLGLRVHNSDGEAVQGEFSLAVVDLAALALADPNAPGILEGLYGVQPLGVTTSLSLAVHAARRISFPGGLGGGGGMQEPTTVAREEFPDTAYWKADIITDADGEAQVTFTLPDNLTTWRLDARGVTMDTRVGEGQMLLTSSKELLLRPVVPRFLVAGDQIMLGAVVHNNTAEDLRIRVTLQSDGLALNNPNEATRELQLPASGRGRVDWWVTAMDVTSADIIFSAEGAASPTGAVYADEVRVARGHLPILRYASPQTYATSGVMADEGQRLELVSLPVSYTADKGELKLDLSSSLAAAMLESLQQLEENPYNGSEQTLSSFLPNLEIYRAIQSFGVESPDMQTRLERTLESGIESLLSRQNTNGGWGWWTGGESDNYVSAYILFGLRRAHEAGAPVPESTIQRAVDYLYSVLPAPAMVSQNWQLDRLVFTHFALAEAGAGDAAGASALFQMRDRLNVWAQALLSLTLASIDPEDGRAQLLVSDIEAQAVRSGTGVHWENQGHAWQNMVTPNTATAIVVYSLAQLEPASTLLPDAVRYLMSNRQRDGGWFSTYETAWVIMANSAFMLGTGELSGDFAFTAILNGSPVIQRREAGDTTLTPIKASLPIEDLYPDDPNALIIQRGFGTGRLYYTAALTAYRPPESAAPLDAGLNLSRGYFKLGEGCTQADCPDVNAAQEGEQVRVRLTLVLPDDVYNLLVEDYIPAGAEILDTSLKTSQQGEPIDPTQIYPQDQILENGWGWWLFHTPQNYDERIVWAADHLPAGTYELNYTLSILQAGEFQILPAHAWLFYFPEVQGSSQGSTFTIRP